MAEYGYTILYEQLAEGGYQVIEPALPGIVTYSLTHHLKSSRFGSLRPRVILRALQKAGFYVHEQSGSHVQLKYPTQPGE